MARVSKRGVDLVASFEGFRSRPYRDPVGIWTIGYGETRGVTSRSRPVTETQARRTLETRLNEDFVPRIPNREKLNQNQLDALASFVYNLGPGALATTTGIGRALRRLDHKTVADQLLRWTYAGGRSLPGLVRRRQAERKLYLEKPRKRRIRRKLGVLLPFWQTTTLDGVPLFRGHKRALLDARRNGWSGRVNSADRRKGVAEKYGKLSQAALYLGWLARKAGFAPANPPGRSTHELRSDGVAYRGPVGRPLAAWQLGLDTSEATELRRVLTRLGYEVSRPYVREEWHTNFRKSPARHWKARRRQGKL